MPCRTDAADRSCACSRPTRALGRAREPDAGRRHGPGECRVSQALDPAYQGCSDPVRRPIKARDRPAAHRHWPAVRVRCRRAPRGPPRARSRGSRARAHAGILLDEEHGDAGRVDLARRPANISSTMIGASPSEGSSSMQQRGPAISPRPIATICCSPPDSVPASCCRRSLSRGNIANTCSSRSRRRGARCAVGADRGDCRAPSCRGTAPRPSGTCTMPRAHDLRRRSAGRCARPRA